jgi:hypothetical protein
MDFQVRNLVGATLLIVFTNLRSTASTGFVITGGIINIVFWQMKWVWYMGLFIGLDFCLFKDF